MKKNWDLSPEDFEALLKWLDEDREKAGAIYEKIRQRLVRFFVARGAADAEDLADETINRVTSKIKEIQNNFTGDRLRYFHGVAKNVWMENSRKPPPPEPPPPSPDSSQIEQEYRCLEECIQRLTPKNRELLLQYYYPQEGCSLTEQRKRLAETLDIAPNALRIRAYRIRAWLQKCIEKCLARAIE
jgi:DNA-directed RNA polymerase specialized sigma24 family protein